MKQNNVMTSLPESFFQGKDGTTYRFTILKDIAVAGAVEPIPYDDSLRDEIIGLYPKYSDFALYVHCPWCIEHCSYCHYYRGPMLKRAELERMLEAEKKHLQMIDDHIDLSNRNVRSIYFGGGTPTILPTELLESTMAYYVDRFKPKDGECEVCLECSPITLKPKKIEALAKYIDRLSVGIQSFDDRILKLVERKHTAAQAKEIIAEVVPLFPSVNVDLIYGLNEQSLSDWLASVEIAINLKAQSLTIYRLDIREIPAIIKAFRQDPDKFPDEMTCWRMYNEAREMLESAGYRENLVGWFLLPQVKDTTVYRERWQKQSPCIALGPQLHNYAADHFYETIYDHDQYNQAIEAGKLPVKHFYKMTNQKKLAWYVLAQLKSNSPIYRSVMIERFGESITEWFMGIIRHYIDWGVIIDYGNKMEFNSDFHYILEWMLIEMIGHLKGDAGE